jgi:predicted  nucleic acid-binding Zn-ribbon protein
VTAVLEKSRQEHENQLKQIMLAKDTELKQKCHDISSSYKQEKKRLKALVSVHEQDLRSTRDEMKRLQQSLAHQQRMLLAVTQSSFLLPDPSSVKE